MSWIEPARAAELQASGAHEVLAHEATARMQAAGLDYEFLYEDGVWMHRAGEVWFADAVTFDYAEGAWAKWGEREAKFLRDADDYWFHVYKPRAGDVIVDIGAGRGEDVFAFSRAVGSEGTVWALEAHPHTYALLRAFCRKNRLDNVRLLHCAAMDRTTTLRIETLPVWESNFVYEGAPTATSHDVRALRFDELCAEQGIARIDFLKMNIEGAERFALKGMPATLRRIPWACIAAHDFRAARGEGEEFRTHNFVVETLQSAGFTLTLRSDDPRYYVKEHIHASR